MIFVTVGTELPFDRLTRTVDQWVADSGRSDVFAQIGDTKWRPTNMAFCTFLEPADFAQRFASADAIVSHAGMGTILSALRYQKPILVMPRLAQLGEQRTDHQLATARQLASLGKISVAQDEMALRRYLDQVDGLSAKGKVGAFAQPELLSAVRDFIAATSSRHRWHVGRHLKLWGDR